MKRRDFIFKGVGAGLVSGFALSADAFGKNFESLAAAPKAGAVDMVAIKGGEPEVMFEKGIAALGGMSRFVKKGQTVVVKPNIGWDVVPERAANTNPKLVAKIVEHCYKAGAKKVYVFDRTCQNWKNCYTNSGIEKAAKDAGAEMVGANSVEMFKEVQIPKGKNLKSAKVHELILNCDVFINVPVLKSHGGSTLSISMKNLMGIVWDRGFYHSHDLHQCIADLPTWRKPDLNIVDAYRVMMRNGPQGTSINDVTTMKAQLISTDMVAVDAAATKLFGLDPKNIPHIVYGAEHGVGTMDLEKLNIKRLTV